MNITSSSSSRRHRWPAALASATLTVALFCPAALAQSSGYKIPVPPVPPAPVIAPDIVVPPVVVPDVRLPEIAELQAAMVAGGESMRAEMARASAEMARAQLALDLQDRPNVRSNGYAVFAASGSYDAGISLLNAEQWDRAIEVFDRVIKAGKTRVDGAMYWKAYALDRIGKRSEAIAVLQELEKSHPNSRWLGDAKALELEVKQNAGQAVKPEDHGNEDLKLLAMNSVMQSDPERGVPMLQQVLKERNSLKVKERALFVLAQSSSPKAKEALAQVARGAGNPDLQMKAVRYLGIYGRSNTQLLADIYAGTKDTDVKREIIRSLMMARDTDKLLNIAKTEPDAELRTEAVRQLGMMRAETQLLELYQGEKAGQLREEIMRSLMMSGNADRMADLARQESDAKLRASAVRNLGMMSREKDNGKIAETLVQIYKGDKDPGVKKAVVNALYMQHNAKALVDLARAETDQSLKRDIVSRLSTMKSKEATDYMLELLK